MQITNYLNTNKEEVENKNFNIWIGISLGNKYFTKENIRKYIEWALENTKDDVLVLIADKIHAINYEVRNKYKKERALNVAIRKGQEVKQLVQEIKKELPKEKQEKINIIKWGYVEGDSQYKEDRRIIENEFETNSEFRKAVLEATKKDIKGNFSKEGIEKLSSYVLAELPIFLKGLRFSERTYTLFPYPGFGKIDDLVVDILEGEKFPELTKKLNIKSSTAILEAYVD